MGNHLSSSSCFLISFSKTDGTTAKLFDAQGNLLRRVKLPLKAAELMLEEEPGHVISPVDELQRTSRFTAMRAEDELSAKKAYLLVPLSRVNRKVSESDMALIESATCKKRSTRKNSKVSPAMAAEEGDGLVTNDVFEVNANNNTVFLGCRRAYNRGWKPVLEPISET